MESTARKSWSWGQTLHVTQIQVVLEDRSHIAIARRTNFTDWNQISALKFCPQIKLFGFVPGWCTLTIKSADELSYGKITTALTLEKSFICLFTGIVDLTIATRSHVYSLILKSFESTRVSICSSIVRRINDWKRDRIGLLCSQCTGDTKLRQPRSLHLRDYMLHISYLIRIFEIRLKYFVSFHLEGFLRATMVRIRVPIEWIRVRFRDSWDFFSTGLSLFLPCSTLFW